ncbi:SpaA isopeptide-forming pilin-related protein [Enterococcus sp. DIV0187]|uniref:SpaA isopeptide-forming pilin-related protein n=1 Tax=Enterococcus sp. DIV0187 TaxID=2774644 RepID=UPI003F684991
MKKNNLILKKIGLIFFIGLVTAFFKSSEFGLAEESGRKLEPRITEYRFGEVYYDTANLYTMRGTKNGVAWSDVTASLAIKPQNGEAQMVFCIQPGVPLSGGAVTGGYEGVSYSNLARRAQVASCIWQSVFPNKTQHEEITARAVVWNNLTEYNLNITSIDQIPEYPQLRAKLDKAIDNYEKKPNFHGKTIDLTFGETKKVQSAVDLRLFDTVVQNEACIDFKIASDGMSVDITPKDVTKTSGSYVAKRSYMEGTPIMWAKEGSQSVVTPAISDPNFFRFDTKINTTGEIRIRKMDKDTNELIPNTTFDVTFSGANAPAKKTVKTGANGEETITTIPNGVNYKITETNVPKPYVLASAVGESDSTEGTVKAGETITYTARNVKATGQIIIEKSGVESGKDPWNDNYSRAGNVFEIREKDKDGKVVETITSNDKGTATSSNKLPLGTYYVSEKTAANGFADTFKPVTVKIEYQDQKTPVVVVNTDGTNQEVTGYSILTKEDEETQNETQGRASFEGTEYTLFNSDDTPVKWTDKFKPELTNGTKVETEDDSIVIRIDDKDQTAGVKHLALNKYYWKETKAPEGYQIDPEKREFELKYKDQETKVVAADVTSKEKVIKFTIDGFKYLQSKGGNVNSGYNGIKFALTPIDPTKGDVVEVETETNAEGYDGYWAFKEFPYGDYKISEVAAPDGYKKMKDLILKSTFDEEKREYNVTVTEDGQKEPIKTLTVPESKINEGSNHISLGKLMITNHLVKAPQISTKASVDGKPTFIPGKDTPMKDTINLSDMNKDGKYRLKAIKLWRIKNDDKENAKVVYEADEDFIADAENMEKVVETLVDTSKDDENTRYVWTEKLAEVDEEGNEKEVAEHEDLDNKEQTVTPEIPKEEEPKIETLFVTTDGDQEIDATKDQKLVDKVSQDFPESQVGQKKYWVHKLHKVSDTKTTETTSSNKTSTSSSTTTTDSTTTSSSAAATESKTTKDIKSEVLETINDTREVKKGKEEFNVDFQYYAKKYNLKDGEKLVVTHEVFNDEKHEDKYADHFDLNNEKQTIRPKSTEPEKTTPTSKPENTEKSIPQTGSYNAFQEFFSAFFN